METIKTIWNFLVLLVVFAYFGGLAKVNYSLGKSAIDLHEGGMFSLASWNRKLVGESR